MDFKLKTEYVELDNLLKAVNLVENGVEAKQRILAGEIKVNGQIETRIRKKLRQGDAVGFGEQHINIIA